MARFFNFLKVRPYPTPNSQRHGIRGDAAKEKFDTQPLKIASDLAAPPLYSRAGAARLLHCIK